MANWFYYDNDTAEKRGPINDTQLKILAGNGQIRSDTILENETGQQGRAEQIKGLQFTTSQEQIPPKTLPLEIMSGAVFVVAVGAVCAVAVAAFFGVCLGVSDSGVFRQWSWSGKADPKVAPKVAIENVVQEYNKFIAKRNEMQPKPGDDGSPEQLKQPLEILRPMLQGINASRCPDDFQKEFTTLRFAVLDAMELLEKLVAFGYPSNPNESEQALKVLLELQKKGKEADDAVTRVNDCAERHGVTLKLQE